MPKSDSERSKQYAKTEKGKETEARKQEQKKEKRKALAVVRLNHDRSRLNFAAAKFSKRYTVHNVNEVKQIIHKQFDHATKTIPANKLGLNGLGMVTIKRQYNKQLAETPECVQGGIPRWSESILNPTYVRKLMLMMGELEPDKQEKLNLRMRKLMRELRGLLDGKRKSRPQKPR
jgi:hypothetical protein